MQPSDKVMPYVYIGVHRQTGEFYIGSRYSVSQRLPSHLDIYQYRTSSQKVRPIFDEFDWEIVAEFFTAEDAWDHEQSLICANSNDPLILNGRYYAVGGHRFIFKHHSPESRRKLSEMKKGKKLSEQHRNNLKKSKNRGNANSQYGQTFKFVNKDGQHKKVPSERIEEFLDAGWAIGRLPQQRPAQYTKKV